MIKKVLNKIRSVVKTKKKVVANIVQLCPSQLLQNRVALITGGTSGIGLDMAIAFINAGATVIITGRKQSRIDKACEEINSKVINKNKIIGFVMDVTDIKHLDDSFIKLLSLPTNGKIDILVNNAGLHGGDIKTSTVEEYDNIMNTNLRGPFFMIQKMADYMVKNHIEGNILNVASASGIRPATSAYHLSKWGLRGLTEGMARLLAPYGIIVNAIAPGPTATPMLMNNGIKEDISHPRNLLGRYALPEEIANMAVILVSNMGRTIIGDTVYMSGGGGIVTNEDTYYKY